MNTYFPSTSDHIFYPHKAQCRDWFVKWRKRYIPVNLHWHHRWSPARTKSRDRWHFTTSHGRQLPWYLKIEPVSTYLNLLSNALYDCLLTKRAKCGRTLSYLVYWSGSEMEVSETTQISLAIWFTHSILVNKKEIRVKMWKDDFIFGYPVHPAAIIGQCFSMISKSYQMSGCNGVWIKM